MFKHYTANYYTFEKLAKAKTLELLKRHLENAMGNNFKYYETAWISEYNILGRRTAQHYFSKKDKRWHKSPNPITMFSSWNNASEPFKLIARWLLITLGYKVAQDKEMNEFIQRRKINELSGK